jgi:tetratricopeptide (TPR) repeat protein
VPDVAALRREIEDAHAALRGATHFAVLGLTPDASEGDVRQAFARLARRYHPDAQRDTALADVRQKLVDVFVAISDAYAVLKDAGERERYQRTLGRHAPRAGRAGAGGGPASGATGETADEPIESRLLRAEEALGASQPWEAIRLLEEAVPAAPAGLKVRAYVLLGRAYAARERPREAEKALQAALQADPRSLSACLALGRFYRDQGLVKRARGMFERALEIDAGQSDAMRELSALPDDAPDSPPKGSLLSRLRGERR